MISIPENLVPLPIGSTDQFLTEKLGIKNPRTKWPRVFFDPITNQVKELNLSGLGVKRIDLAFVEKFPALEQLSLYDNMLEVVDLTPLQICKHLNVLSLNGNNFGDFLVDLTPLEACPSLEYLNLAGDITLASAEPNLSRIKLARIPNLKTLDLGMNSLDTIDLSPLSSCPKLDTLDLSWNDLNLIEFNQIQTCKNLRSLNLSHNHLQVFLPEAFFPSLKNLNLGFNKIDAWTADIGILIQIECLDLSYNPLKKLPPGIEKLQHLRALTLSELHLQEIPALHGCFPELIELQLHNVPEGLRQALFQPYPHLTKANFSKNGLAEVPTFLRDCLKLKNLDLGFNRLTTLPTWFGDLVSLETIDLSGNPLQSFPEVLLRLKTVEYLSLRGIDLASLPSGLLKMPALKTLYVSDKLLVDPVVKALAEKGVFIASRWL